MGDDVVFQDVVLGVVEIERMAAAFRQEFADAFDGIAADDMVVTLVEGDAVEDVADAVAFDARPAGADEDAGGLIGRSADPTPG